MGWRWLRALVIGLWIGPGPAAAEPVDVEPLEATPTERVGRAIEGPRFLVWDEDPPQADAWASELLRADLAAAVDRGLGFAPDGQDGSSPAASALGRLLCRLPSLSRTFVVATLATSPDERSRRAIAGALSARFEAIGVATAIEHLRSDTSPEVRRLAGAAAASRQLRRPRPPPTLR